MTFESKAEVFRQAEARFDRTEPFRPSLQPRGVKEAEQKRLMWAINDRIEARISGVGVMAELPPEVFKAAIILLLDEIEELR
jgi:hypothetical protein